MRCAFVFFMLIVYHRVQAKDVTCDFNDLTQNCSFFSPDRGPKINLPDGTFIANFSISSVNKKKSAELERSGTEDNQRILYQDLQFQVRAMEVIDQLPSSEFSDVFKIYLANKTGCLRDVMLDKGKDYTLPWPPVNPEGMKSVPASEVQQFFKSKLNSDQKEQLNAIAKDFEGEEVKRGENIEVSSNDVDPVSELRRQMTTITEERKKKVKDLIEFSRRTIIDKIKMGRPMVQLTEHEKKMVNKIEGIRVTSPDNTDLRVNSRCTGLTPNAFYDTGDHSINVCPNFYNYPDSTIIGIVGHEIGHAVDPCNCQFGHHQVDQDRINLLMGQDVVRNNNDQFNALYYLKEVTHDSNLTSYPFTIGLTTNQMEFLSTSKALSRQSPDTSFDNYPLKDVYNCLIRPAGGGFRNVSKKDIEDFATSVVENRAQILPNQYNPNEDKAAIIQAFSAHPECMAPGRSGQTGEAVADWFGAEVIGEYLKGKKLVTNEERLAPIAFFASMVCFVRMNREKPEVNVSSGAIVVKAMLDVKMDNGPHPASQKRIEQILLRNPQIQEAMGCKGSSSRKKCKHRPQVQATMTQQVPPSKPDQTEGAR